MFRGVSLTVSHKDAMLEFMWKSVGRVLDKDSWGSRPVPQGVSVFNKRDAGDFEYMFTKDERYDGKVDWREDRDSVMETLRAYTPEGYSGVVLYMNEDALKIASKHQKMAY